MATFNVKFDEGVITVITPIQHKRGTEAKLAEADYVPAAGEIVVATDTGQLKAGDGEKSWNELPYVGGTANNSVIESLQQTIQKLTARVTSLENQFSYAYANHLFDEIFAGNTDFYYKDDPDEVTETVDGVFSGDIVPEEPSETDDDADFYNTINQILNP